MNLYAEDCVKVKNDLYFIAKNINIIYRINIETSEFEIVDSLYDAPTELLSAGASILEYDGKLYFPPMSARWLSYYDLASKEWNTIEIETIDNCYWGRFFNAVIYYKTIHLIGSHYPAIVSINLETTEIKTSALHLYESLKKNKEMFDDCYIRKDFAIVGEKLYAASCVSNQVLIYDLKTQKACLETVGDSYMRFSGIVFDGENFWLTARRYMEFYRWDVKTSIFETFKISNIADEDFYVGGVVFDGKNLILKGMYNQNSYIVNPFAEDVQSTVKEIYESYVFVKNYGDVDYCMTSDGFLEEREIEDFGKVIKRIDVNIEDSRIFDYVEKKDGILHESQTLSLNAFINNLV